ncbi:tyrosine-type recombinase/integrase [Vibrio breoganii]|uniref:tyrosine-type recombinase/integrase n=1 Tax=Vibrio breoganii TaxID=553239 RepID=UPI000C859C72|nr:integrase family protein [Vibrio breoganii]PMK30623.1 hypothetical protein BCU03_09405 [Vibrio breoganii]
MKLTAMFVKKVSPPEERSFEDHPDGNGLLLRVTRKGHKAFYYRYRFDGKAVMLKVGDTKEMSLKDAREKHIEYRKILADGKCPRKELAIRASSYKKELTVKEAFSSWFDNRISYKRSAYQISRMLETRLYPVVGDLPINSMDNSAWIKVMQNKDTPVHNVKLLALVKAGIRWLRETDQVNNSAMNILHIRASTIGRTAKPRDRVLTIFELRRIYSGMNSMPSYDPTIVACMKIILFSGCRQGELRQARRSHIDLDERIWTVPADISKTFTNIVRPIPDFMIPWFKVLLENSANDYLVHNSQGNVYCPSPFRKLLDPVRKNGGVTDWVIHSTRHSLATNLADAGIDPFICERILGHKVKGVMGVYQKGLFLEKQLHAMNTYYSLVTNQARDTIGTLYVANSR